MRTLCIFGPTASGKSALALALAARLDAWIVNADSMQVYRDLRVLTARPNPEEESLAPHALFGVIDASERYSVGRWLADAMAAIADARAAGRRAILVGGTGLYFEALTRGLVETPPVDPQLRAQLAVDLARLGAPALHARLAERDPVGAGRLSPNDAPRILRALEVLETAGAPLRALQAVAHPPLAPQAWLGVALVPDRQALYGVIEQRFAAMLQQGALEEARALAARGLDPALPAMKAHGAPWLMSHLRGALRLEDAAALSVRDTRRYAKRQFTWMAGRMADWARIVEVETHDRAARIETILRELEA